MKATNQIFGHKFWVGQPFEFEPQVNDLSRAIRIQGRAKSAEREGQTDLLHLVEAYNFIRKNEVLFSGNWISYRYFRGKGGKTTGISLLFS